MLRAATGHKREKRLLGALEAARMGTWRRDIRTNIDTRDAGLNSILGLPVVDSSQPIDDFLARVHPDDRASVAATFQRAVQECGNYEVEFRIIRPDGMVRWLHDRGKVISGQDDEPVFMTGVMVDITASRHAEGARGFLDAASALLSSSLEVDATFHHIARLVVPALADWCIIDIAADDGAIQTLAFAHADPAKEPLLQEMVNRYTPNPRAPTGTARVLRTGRWELARQFPPDLLERQAIDAGHLRLLRGLGINSALWVPLNVRGRTVGAIALIVGDSDRRYSEDDLPLIEAVSHRAALAVDNARLHQETQRQARRAQALATASHAFAEASLDLQAVFDRITRQVAELIGDFCAIRLVSDDQQWLVTAAAYHPNPAAAQLVAAVHAVPYRIDEGFMGQVVQTGQTLRIPSLDQEQVRAGINPTLWQYLDEFGLYSLLMVPLRVRGQIIGAIGATRCRPERPYTRDDQIFLQDLADRAVLAIDHARLYTAEREAKELAERAAERTSRLQLVTAALAASPSRTQAAEVVLLQGIATMGAYAGLILLRSPDGATFELLGQTGYLPEVSEIWRTIPADSTLPIIESAQSSAPIWIPSLDHSQERYAQIQSLLYEQTAALACIPLIVDARSIGVIGLSFAEPQTFSAEDRAFMQSLAQQCAQAIERTRLYEAERDARAEAEAAVRTRDVFLSIASHELKTPLTSLLASVQLLQRRFAREGSQDERNRRALEIINAQAARLNAMVTALLDISRLQTGQLSIERVPVDLCELTQRVVDEMQLTLSRQHTISYQGQDAPLMIDGDAVRLEQVLQNLIGNGVKYSPAGGTVWVQVQRRDAMACLVVRDQGIGIPSAALPHLFQRFYRAANVDAQHISGLGIGLYVVKEVVALHGGTVMVESIEGSGSTFIVYLPSVENDEQRMVDSVQQIRRDDL